MRIINMNSGTWQDELNGVLARSQLDLGNIPDVVAKIVEDVRTRGDDALFEYTREFDKVDITAENIAVSKEEIKNAYAACGDMLVNIIEKSADRIRDFHERQKRTGYIDTYPGGELMGQLVRPVEKAGVYCPGGTAAYPSSVLMNIIPAKTAGVPEIIMCTPPGRDGIPSPAILVAADIAGADTIYKAGGAQAIAAMAYGTVSIPRVDKITGPGNIYVALAKRAVYGYVGIDSVAGPSEILIIADDTANPAFVAADLLSQAEHDELSAAVLITVSETLAGEVSKHVTEQCRNLSRRQIAERSLKNNGAIVIVRSLSDAFEISNKIAPEHLEICVSDAFSALSMVKNAGAVFLGNYTPEALGDYMAGPNHILPTGGTSRFFSPLCVDDFYKKISLLSFSKASFGILAKDCAAFADAEGLDAHANSVRIRTSP